MMKIQRQHQGTTAVVQNKDKLFSIKSSRKKSAIEEQWEQQQGFELTSVEQETYEKYFYGTEHWNYFTNDDDLGPVILSIKQETLNGRDQFRILVRAISYTVHGLIPASCVFADRYFLQKNRHTHTILTHHHHSSYKYITTKTKQNLCSYFLCTFFLSFLW